VIEKQQYERIYKKTLKMLDEQKIVLTEEEKQQLEIADFGLGEVETTGLQIITYVNTDRVCAKELIMLPGQTCPEHLHPAIDGAAGKEETFRCRAGEVYLYVAGKAAEKPSCKPPEGMFTVWHEVRLLPGEQYTLMPDTLHWFQAGVNGAIVSEFSTRSADEADIFTDKRIVRVP